MNESQSTTAVPVGTSALFGESELDQLRRDKERLDWLMGQVNWRMLPSGFLCYEFVTPMFDGVCSINIRARIDAAMKLQATPDYALPSPNTD
jgi:hypothetical protein